MSLTDQDLLEEVQRAVIEPPDLGATWPSGLWTAAEIQGYATQRQDRLLKDTLCVVSWLDQALVVQSQQDLPDGWLATRNIFLEYNSETLPLTPVDRREADLLLATWNTTAGRPQWYIEEEWGTRQISLVPLPALDGTMHIYAALVGQAFDGSGIQFTVPDEFAPYLWYGVLADMFGKQGRAYDGPRAAYCEARFAEGIALGRTLLQAVIIS